MKKNILLIALFCFTILSNSQNKVLWKPVSKSQIMNKNVSLFNRDNQGVYELNTSLFRSTLASLDKVSIDMKEIISLPNSEGKIEQFLISKSSNFDPVLQEQFPNIQSFYGNGITDPTASVCFSLAENGLQTMVIRCNGKPTEFIEPIEGEFQKYVFYQSDKKSNDYLRLNCKTENHISKSELSKTAKFTSNDRVFRTLRLALSCTGEYTKYHGGTVEGALAAMNATLTRVNGIFNRDLALKLILIADNNKIIFTNAQNDPYSEVKDDAAPDTWGDELQNTLTTRIGNTNYDIGHLFGASGGGGFAGCIGCVCDQDKGIAYTSPSNGKPEGDAFDVDFVAHEFGHQLGATHTYSYEIEDTETNVEPGSGSTIMGYAGIALNYDIQSNSDDYFSYVSINQIQRNLSRKSCLVSKPITNENFAINAGIDYTIPKSTPFVLKATTSGVTSNSFTYVWEQNDTAITASGDNSFAVPDKADGPLFRSLPPSNSLIRYFPNLKNVLINKLDSEWESVSSIGRSLKFVCTARNNANSGLGQTASDEVKITVSNTAGPFEVTSQDKIDLSWPQGSSQMITWNVNETDVLPGADRVHIKLSTDGGLSFPTTLVANTPNDGSQTIFVPDVLSQNCRILIEPTNSIFYAVNSKPFAIGYIIKSICDTYSFATPIAINDGSGIYTESKVVIPSDLGTIIDVDIEVTLTHSYFSDVELDIVSPNGDVVRLLERVCEGDGGKLTLKFDDSGKSLKCLNANSQIVAPKDFLSTFNQQDPKGTWILRVRDLYNDDTGSIDFAKINICTQKTTLDNSSTSIVDFDVFPNPSSGTFKIKYLSSSKLPINVTVADLAGRKVYQKQFESTNNFNKNIELINLVPGIYILYIEDGNRTKEKKIVIH